MTLGFEFFDDLKFCEECVISLRGCKTGGGVLGREFYMALSNATGCRIEGYNVDTYANLDNGLPGGAGPNSEPTVTYEPGDEDVTKSIPDPPASDKKKK